MFSRKPLSISFVVFLGLSTVVTATPTKQEMAELAAMFDNNAADDLANLRVCGKLELHSQYLQSLLGAGMAHPNVDPQKISALVRQIQRKATALAEMRMGFNQGTPPEEVEAGCRFDVRQAVKHLEALDDFIFNS